MIRVNILIKNADCQNRLGTVENIVHCDEKRLIKGLQESGEKKTRSNKSWHKHTHSHRADEYTGSMFYKKQNN